MVAIDEGQGYSRCAGKEIAPICIRMDRRSPLRAIYVGSWQCFNSTEETLVIRCLFAHEWVTLWEKSLGTIACFRKCKRCGILERGVLDLSKVVGWETMRERSSTKAQQVRVVRQPLPRLDRLAHSFGLRRTRMNDGTGLERLTSWIRD